VIRVSIPATSANLGPGFDCIGMAFDMYNVIEVEETSQPGVKIEVVGEGAETIPLDETNLVLVSMKAVFEQVGYDFKGLKITLYNDIPLTRGLGSSAACIAGGMMAANELSGSKLTLKQIINKAAQMDGHPDNVLPAIIGGLTVGCLYEDEVYYSRLDPPTKMDFIMLIPDFELETVKARSVLPTHVSISDAIFNISRAALMIASMMTGNTENLLVATDDRLHQPYRKKLIPNFEEILVACKENGAKGVFLSGAGPTIIVMLDGGQEEFIANMKEFLMKYDHDWLLKDCEVCHMGLSVERINEREI